MLTGLAFTMPFAFGGLLFAKVTPRVNRKNTLAIAMALSGLVMNGVGVLDSFAFLAASRFIMGSITAMLNQLQFSLLADYFPPE